MNERMFRLDALIMSMTERLRPLCANWPQENFDKMVRRLAEITLKYEGEINPSGLDHEETDRLVADMKILLDRSSAARDTRLLDH